MNDSPQHVRRDKPKWLRLILARPRLGFSIFAGVLVAILLPQEIFPQAITRSIMGWNAGALLYLVLAMTMMFGSNHERMRTRALMQDEGSAAVLMLVVVTAVACVGAIVAELAVAKAFNGTQRYAHIGLAVLTIATSWAFTHTMFALHYAHDYYATAQQGAHGGLDFPGEESPDYGDFVYFAFVIGTSGQTADVAFRTRKMRRTGTVHCVLAFFFNTTLLALTINIASGLF